nr:hypothetical protein [Hydrogenophaga sp.]
MVQLLHVLASQFQLSVQGLRGLLDEGVHHHHKLADQKAVERASDACAASWPQLEEAVAHCTGVRQAEVCAVLGEQFDQVRIVGRHIDRPCLNLGQNARVEVFDFVSYALM